MEGDEMSDYLLLPDIRRPQELKLPSNSHSSLRDPSFSSSLSVALSGLAPHASTTTCAPHSPTSPAPKDAHAVLVLLPDGSARLYEASKAQVTAGDVLAQFPRHTLSLLASRRPSAALLPHTCLLPHNTYYLHAAAGAAGDMPPLPASGSGNLRARPPRMHGGSSHFPLSTCSVDKGWDERSEGAEAEGEREEDISVPAEATGGGGDGSVPCRRGMSCQFPVEGRFSRTPSPHSRPQEASTILSFHRAPRMRRPTNNGNPKSSQGLPPRCSSSSGSGDLDFPLELLLATSASGDAARALGSGPGLLLPVATGLDLGKARCSPSPHRGKTQAAAGLVRGRDSLQVGSQSGRHGQGRLSRTSSLGSSFSLGAEEQGEGGSGSQAGNSILQELEMWEKEEPDAHAQAFGVALSRPGSADAGARGAASAKPGRTNPLGAGGLSKGAASSASVSSSSSPGSLLANLSSLKFLRARPHAKGAESKPQCGLGNAGQQQAGAVETAGPRRTAASTSVRGQGDVEVRGGRFGLSKVVKFKGKGVMGLHESWNGLALPQSCAPALQLGTAT